TEFANVASNGARKEVLHGIEPEKVVSDCLKKAFKNKKIAVFRFKWKCSAFFSRFVSRFFVANFMYKNCKRPYKNES
ncbi:MAG: short-chain dehydrogenase, partial [Spirochaetia bacterium]|nr:short-chain dehydrogenase [Spirochaetia bacterium]